MRTRQRPIWRLFRLFRMRRGSLLLTGAGKPTSGGGGGGTPAFTEIGSNQSAAAASMTISSAAVAQNKRIVVAVGYEPGGGASVSSITDARGNTYAAVGSGGLGSISVALWSANAGTALQASDLITVNMSNGTSRILGLAGMLDNVLTASVVDQVSTVATGTSTAPASPATGTTAQASEIAIGVIGTLAASTFTAGGGYTKSASQPANGIVLNVEFLVLSATGTQTASGTLGTSTTWAALVATFKGS